jgi:hypothetical protein
MTVRFSRALRLMLEMRLPVYIAQNGDYQCHFSHVVKSLVKIALTRNDPNYDNQGIEERHLASLQAKWEMQYPDLLKRKPIPDLHSGKVLAGNFIVQCVKNVALNEKVRNLQSQAFNIKAMQEEKLL